MVRRCRSILRSSHIRKAGERPRTYSPFCGDPAARPFQTIDLKDIFPWFPPRAVCHIDHRSVLGHSVHGIYIDSFIPPDRLGPEYREENIGRVRDAATCAIKAGARIVSLGGFSSILIEGDSDHLPEKGETVFTTGNTLTVAFVVQGVKKMCALQGRDMSEATLLIVGATGDVGSGCARCLAPLVHRVVLNARNIDRLRGLARGVERRRNGRGHQRPISSSFPCRPIS